MRTSIDHGALSLLRRLPSRVCTRILICLLRRGAWGKEGCSYCLSSRYTFICSFKCTIYLTIYQDTVAVHPSQFSVPPEQAIMNELNKKYANRVLHDVGLCVCVFDLSEVGEGKVRYGDGFLWYKGEHRTYISFIQFTDLVTPIR